MCAALQYLAMRISAVLIYIYFVRALINDCRSQNMHLFFPGVFRTYLCVINVDFDRWRKMSL